MSTESLHEWDAAYVLGALSPDDRRTFEEHLEGCAECRASVAELAGLPALLSRVPAPSLDDGAPAGAATSHVAPADSRAGVAQASVDEQRAAQTLPVLARTVHRRRLRRRWFGSGTAVLAAAAIAVAVIVPMRLDAPPAPTAALALAQVAPSPLTATVDVTKQAWGTSLAMTCAYRDVTATPGYAAASGRYALYVTDASGTATRVASWSAWPGATIHASGAVDLPVSQLRTVEVRDAASGAVLLSSPVRAGR